MSENSANNKRIAKNTALLYIRMIFLMCIALFTSRVILDVLGVEDYGIYNVIGGVVLMFSFISGSLATAAQRYITFELGKENNGNLKEVFSTFVTLHVALGILIAIIAEPIGLWFIYNKMMIPESRLNAAFWVFQFSVISLIVMLISVPYNALIIAHERMNAFAAISVVEAILRLAIVYSLLLFSEVDKLILYGVLMLIVQVVVRFLYTIYCKRHFEESEYKFVWNKKLVHEVAGFVGWSIFGNVAFISYTQGLNLLLGTFFVPAVNAARGIAVQVQGAVNSFVSNFQTAINPQITKQYAAGNLNEMVNLVFKSSRFSFYLLMLTTLPIMLETELILKLWLGQIPPYTIEFMRIILLTTWINSIANPLIVSVKATGHIQRYESTVSIIMMCILPISYVLLRLGYNAVSVFIVHLVMEICAMSFRISITSKMINFKLSDYFQKVLFRLILVSMVALFLPLLCRYLMTHGIWNSILTILIAVFSSILSVYFVGLESSEKQFISSKVLSNFQKH